VSLDLVDLSEFGLGRLEFEIDRLDLKLVD
jgi:hypothetical protein